MSSLVNWLAAVAATSLAVVTCSGRAHEGGVPQAAPRTDAAKGRHLKASDRLVDLLEHPAFAGFAPMLLPWDGRAYDERMPLTEIASLLPYHSDVRPSVAVDALNRMIDDAGRGRTIFYPLRNGVGLFHFRGRPGAPLAVVSPGGGFSYVGALHEGFPYAVEINRHRYNAFVLRYRAGRGAQAATEDLAAAIAFIRRNAKRLDVDAEQYSLWGSSAGARMAASVEDSKPAAVIMAYTGHSDVTTNEPPTFVVVGERDGIAPPAVMERRVSALRNAGAVVEYRKYQGVGHGFGLGTGTNAEGWAALAVEFWERTMRPQRP
jgi:acetyl esterase/lipase